jgi:tRNA (guanine37-N1)-methyltransferase
MQFSVITLFPEMLDAVAKYGVVGRAIDNNIVSLRCVNPREFTMDAHRTVDDRPYGGGPGMVMKFEPLSAAIDKARETMPAGTRVICMSPQGVRFDQAAAQRLTALPGMILLAGRYEGIDERLIEAQVDEELSLGDYVLSGGEIAAMAVIDATVRLLPGVLGDDESALQDSFSDGLLDFPHYTRPEMVDGRPAPEVLLSGDHAKIRRWRLKQAIGRSYTRRPELVEKLELDVEQKQLLAEYLEENSDE